MFTQTTTRKLYTLDELTAEAAERAYNDWINCPDWDGLQTAFDELNRSVASFNASIGISGRWIDMHGPGTEKYFYDLPDVFEALEMINGGDMFAPASDGYFVAEDMRAAWEKIITPGVAASLRFALYVCETYQRYAEALEPGEADALIYDCMAAEAVAVDKIREALEAVAAAVNADAEAEEQYYFSREHFAEEDGYFMWLYEADGLLAGSADALEGLEEVAA